MVAAENRPKDDVVSCRVCSVSGDIVGEICGPQCNEGPRSRCFTLGLWFHVGFGADLVMVFMLFRVGFMSVMLGALKFIALKTSEHHKFLCVFGHGVDSKTRCFMSGWGFVSGLRVPNLRRMSEKCI